MYNRAIIPKSACAEAAAREPSSVAGRLAIG
jgi:hypothetical protein